MRAARHSHRAGSPDPAGGSPGSEAQWDATFSESSFGFRPGRSAHQAVAQAQAFIASGHGWVVDIDLEKFFDRVNHDILMGRVAKRVADKRILKLIRAFLTAGVMENGLVGATDEGTPQGGPLSPLLSNLMLDVLDKELERRGHRFARYADDCNIYVRSRACGRAGDGKHRAFLAKRLKLKMNKAKSAVASTHAAQVPRASASRGARVAKRRIAPAGLARFKDACPGADAAHARAECRAESSKSCPAISLDGAATSASARPRRCCAHWTNGSGAGCGRSSGSNGSVGEPALRNCDRRGVGRELAAKTAGSAHGPWRLSNSPALAKALSNDYFLNTLGLQSLAAGRDRIIRRTAVYGPVRTVVWEGRGREAPPYPDSEARRAAIRG